MVNKGLKIERRMACGEKDVKVSKWMDNCIYYSQRLMICMKDDMGKRESTEMTTDKRK